MVSLLLIRHVLSLRLRDQWKAYWPPLLAGGAMAGCVVLLRTELLMGVPALPRLALIVCGGALIYGGLLRILDPAALRQASHQVRITRVGRTNDPQ
jgi:hypothetical protein